ncbi:hypothetical protein FKP32DRAFT_1726132, partial [Trametes sanguinea]
WFPYPNRTIFLLTILDGLPRLRISDSLLKIFLWIMKQAGVKDVPSFDAFRKVQQRVQEESGLSTIRCKSPKGNIFYINDPRGIIAKDWANPLTRPHMRVYPEIPEDGVIREIWHAGKWHEGMDLSMLSPMYDADDKHYYVNEWARLKDGRYILPQRWVIVNGEVHAEGHPAASEHEQVSDDIIILTSLYCSGPAGHQPPEMPNALRSVAGNEPIYTSFIDHFGDDVSGNRSKSWNKHWNTYITHRNLPRRLLQQEFHTHFISSSQHASVVEQFHDIKKVIEATHHTPVRVLDALTGKMTRFRIFVNAEPSDNPMQSELSGHIGGRGNHFCRKCEAGGSDCDKATDSGYHALFTGFPDVPRTREGVLAEVKGQLAIACRGVEKHVKARQTLTGVKDMYTQSWIEDLIRRARDQKHRGQTGDEVQRELLRWVDENEDIILNPCLQLPGLDPTQDTPVEILHTILLGIVKYAWYDSHISWDDKQKTLYAQRLQSTSTDSLSIHAIRAQYIMQYANSLIGRQLKTVIQTTAFHARSDLCTPIQRQLWLSVGNLTALLWFPEIADLDTYLNDLDIEAGNVLDLFSELDPTKVLEKIKLHLLVHLRQDVRRFGPLIGVCSESFECFNGVFRPCSILSNHLAPSRDIATQLAGLEANKHRLTGAWWQSDSGEWVQASPAVRDFLHRQPALQRMLGWTPEIPTVPGTFKPQPIPRGQTSRPRIQLDQTAMMHTVNFSDPALSAGPASLWIRGQHVTSQAGDICKLGSWVCSSSPIESAVNVIGRIQEILAQDEAAKEALVVLDIFEVASTRHPELDMPWLVRRQGEALRYSVKSTTVKFAFNVQHDCAYAGCTASGKRPVMQERLQSGVMEDVVEHRADVERYIVNMHSLHNPHLIRSILPRSLTAPTPRHADREETHRKFAQQLRKTKAHKQSLALARKEAQQAVKQASSGSDPRRIPAAGAHTHYSPILQQHVANP